MDAYRAGEIYTIWRPSVAQGSATRLLRWRSMSRGDRGLGWSPFSPYQHEFNHWRLNLGIGTGGSLSMGRITSMKSGGQVARQELLNTAVEAVAAPCGACTADDARLFFRFFYVFAARDDLTQTEPDYFAGAAWSLWQLGDQLPSGEPVLRVFNPSLEADGWTCARTVLQAVHEDVPFLADSLIAELAALELSADVVIRPILPVQRGDNGERLGVGGAGETSFPSESYLHIEFDHQPDPGLHALIEARISKVFADVRVVVSDWKPMVARLEQAIEGLKTRPPQIPADELDESLAFLKWLLDDHFTFLGCREYGFDQDSADGDLYALEGSGLGVLRDSHVEILRRGRDLVSMTPEVREFLAEPAPLIITKANVHATVHRRVHMDYVGIKQFDERGRVSGEVRFGGLFTSQAYNESAQTIPVLRRKLSMVLDRSGFNHDNHEGKALLNILESYPRDELFQTSESELYRTSLGILGLSTRRRTKLFVRYDRFDRFVSVLVFVPRERYGTDLRQRVGDLLCHAFNGRVSAFYPQFGDQSLARVHYIIGRNEGVRPEVNEQELENCIAEAARTWGDKLKSVVTRVVPAAESGLFARVYLDAFSAGYQEAFRPEEALEDIAKLEELTSADDLALRYYRCEGDGDREVRLKLYRLNEPISLSARVPMLENMGFRVEGEQSYQVHPHQLSDRHRHWANGTAWIHDIVLSLPDESLDLDLLGENLEAAFKDVWAGQVENDRFNHLVIAAGLVSRDVALLRAFAGYLKQIGSAYGREYTADVLARNGSIAALLVELFYTRYDPSYAGDFDARKQAASEINDRIEGQLAGVSSLDEDRILQRFWNLICACMRTNFFQVDDNGALKTYYSFKFDCEKIEHLPAPRPYAEIFVYAPWVSGVHLRFGKIARGGLRWSDRPEDFRTEVLGLVKAQVVKNAVIVPNGAKGGFVPTLLTQAHSREEAQEEAIRCYRTFISGLLDITDNLVDGKVAAPEHVVRHDGDDSYLVVAADKGTATFSDIANGIAQSYGFWLGDAFASGGSVGYDHKVMGITARGAWEAVKRHFREMDVDIQSTPFTAIGVGDMSGDVFGNGMLLSPQTKLIAAFDHRDIFIDPDPNIEASFAERRRMFEQPRSSWADYDQSIIGEGGGVFSRSLKSIPLSAQMKALTGLDQNEVEPDKLVHALLKAPVDLLWFGGIGTFIKAAEESHLDVGDRSNDSMRIDGSEVGAKVVGEGANLGLTQRGRIEYARSGGSINTDAVDNAAGVNCSDVEVNIKIALDSAVRRGALQSETRDRILAELTDDVSRLVLQNNYLQTLAITVEHSAGIDSLPAQSRLIGSLEKQSGLDRALEGLPEDDTLLDMEKRGLALTRPELSTLVAHVKINLSNELLESDVPDDPYLAADLKRYFPDGMSKKFFEDIDAHRLRREIIATMLANSVVNRGGPVLVSSIRDETGMSAPDIVRAYTIARGAQDILELLGRIDALDNQISSSVQLKMYREVGSFLRRQSIWVTRNTKPDAAIDTEIETLCSGIGELRSCLAEVVSPFEAEAISALKAELMQSGVDEETAYWVAGLGAMGGSGDVVRLAAQEGLAVSVVARVYYAIGAYFHLDWLRAQVSDIPGTDYYERFAMLRAVDTLGESQRTLTRSVLASAEGAEGSVPDEFVMAWAATAGPRVGAARALISELQGGHLTLAKLLVANGQIFDLVHS